MKARSFTQFIVESEEKWLETDPSKLISKGQREHGKREGSKRMKIDDSTKKYKILKFIYGAEDVGRSYTDIIRFIQEDLRGMTYNPSEDRGRYSTYLSGVYSRWTGTKHGLLSQYCKKNSQGRWVISDPILIDHFNKLKEEGKLKTESQLSKLSPEEIDAMKILREIGININPWQ